MKKVISLLLIVAMICSLSVSALAWEVGGGDTSDTTDYTNGTQVEYVGTGNEAYTITVPATMTPGTSGTVTLSGTWASNKTVKVTADKTVELTSNINANDTKVLDVTFAGIEKAGDNTEAKTYTETVSVAEMPSDVLFGIWSGKFNYNVEITTTQTKPTYQLMHKPTGEVTTSTQTFTFSGYDVIDVPVETPTSTTLTYKANEYSVCINNLTTPVTNIIAEDFYVLDYGTFGAVELDVKMLNMTAEEFSTYTAIILWPDYHVAETNVIKTEANFTLEDYTINGETFSVPCVTYTHYFADGSSSTGTPSAMWTYNETTKTFIMGTPNTVITENMKVYTDCVNLFLNVATDNE